MTKKVSYECDKCYKQIEKEKPLWSIDKQLWSPPEDMADNTELDLDQHICLDCEPLGDYEKKKEEAEVEEKEE